RKYIRSIIDVKMQLNVSQDQSCCSCCLPQHKCVSYNLKSCNTKYFKIASNQENGQYLVADEYLQAGIVLATDSPLVVGPGAWSNLICLGCNDVIDKHAVQSCPRCHWPMCSESCTNNSVHLPECEILAQDEEHQTAPENYEPSPLYDLIMVIRCLLLRSQNPNIWNMIISMVSHVEARMETHETQQSATVRFISNYLMKDFDMKTVNHIRGVILTNSIGIQSANGGRLRAIYPTVRLLNNNCIPNIQLAPKRDLSIELRSAVDIEPNTPLCISYTGTLAPLWERCKILNNNYFFSCQCNRCEDLTECGTYFSTHKCNECKEKYLEPNIWLGEVKWQCIRCKNESTLSDIELKMNQWLGRLEFIDMFGVPPSPRRIENIMRKVEASFHKNHYVWLMVAQVAVRVLVECRTNLLGCRLRCELWKQLVNIFNIFERGHTRRRAAGLVELGLAYFDLAQLEIKEDSAYMPHVQNMVNQSLSHLEEGLQILSIELQDSPMEGIKREAKAGRSQVLKLSEKIQEKLEN
ncbi:unnamed protein product, partial [Meganyctiphanes norvegica]